MNYIILSEKVSHIIYAEWKYMIDTYGYLGNIDSYIDELFSFGEQLKIFNRCSKNKEYQIIGKKVRLFIEIDRKYPNSFYAKSIAKFDSEEEYLSKLSQTMELPGDWMIVLFEDSQELLVNDTTDIGDFLSDFKASYGEFYEFEGKWSTWDLYNSKLKEIEEKKEVNSVSNIKKCLIENNIITFTLNEFSEYYKEDAAVSVCFEGQSKYILIGKISDVRRSKKQIDVVCEDNGLILRWNENKLGRPAQAKIVDFGARARINRQRAAMKKLFQNESSNKNLKDILLGNFDWPGAINNEVSIYDAASLFGANIRQKEAYVRALNAPDMFIIQGPPGTGKTTIITELVKKVIEKKKKVLVSSETNIAVDNVLERISREKSIIPVRLGKCDRIEEECQKYIPEEISENVLKKVREDNAFFERNGINEKALVDECSFKGEQKKQQILKEILKLKRKIGVDYDIDKLKEKIEKFEEILLKLNSQYEKILKQEKAYFEIKKKLSDKKQQKSNMEEKLLLLSDTAFLSEFNHTASEREYEKVVIGRSLDDIQKEIQDLNQQMRDNSYEVDCASYNRKFKRFEKYKIELREILGDSESFIAKVHQVGIHIKDIYSLKGQIKSIELSMEKEIALIKTNCLRHQMLWELSKDIRDEWIPFTETQEVREEIEEIYMTRANVVFATCSGIASSDNGHFADMEYDYVIIDEAAKCNMLDLLIPITMGKKIILVGDHKQLYPMLEIEGLEDEISKEQIDELRNHILFKWLYEENIPEKYKIMLDRQYRMERNISEFVSQQFYKGGLICEKDKKNESSMIWIDCENSKEEHKGTSYKNTAEADVIIALLKSLDTTYKIKQSVGVICTYKAQAEYIQGLLSNMSWENISVECSTVDAFQGKEKHTIIFNIVRSERIKNFVKDENRVNVAISRAQEYLYVVGSVALVKGTSAGVISKLYNYVRVHGEIRNSRYMR